MNKENRDIVIKLKVKDKNSRVCDLEKEETYTIEEYGKSLEKMINFKLSFLVVSIIGLITAFFWSRRKRKI